MDMKSDKDMEKKEKEGWNNDKVEMKKEDEMKDEKTEKSDMKKEEW